MGVYSVAVMGWFPENKPQLSGSPERDDILVVEAINLKMGIKLAAVQFQAQNGFCKVLAQSDGFQYDTDFDNWIEEL